MREPGGPSNMRRQSELLSDTRSGTASNDSANPPVLSLAVLNDLRQRTVRESANPVTRWVENIVEPSEGDNSDLYDPLRRHKLSMESVAQRMRASQQQQQPQSSPSMQQQPQQQQEPSGGRTVTMIGVDGDNAERPAKSENLTDSGAIGESDASPNQVSIINRQGPNVPPALLTSQGSKGAQGDAAGDTQEDSRGGAVLADDAAADDGGHAGGSAAAANVLLSASA